MDQIFARLATAFGVTVSAWAAGVVVTLRNLVQCLTSDEGWALFLASQWEIAGAAATLAGPTALVLRLLGIAPVPAPSSPPPENQKE